MRSNFRVLGLAFSALAFCGCGSSAPRASDQTSAQRNLPTVMVAGPGTGPALFFDEEGDAPAIGYLSPGTRLRIEGQPAHGRVAVTVGGPLTVRGWVPLERVGLIANRRGRVPSTNVYLGAGDFVNVTGIDGDSFRVRVAAQLTPGIFAPAADSVVPQSWLADHSLPGELNEGEERSLPIGSTLQIFDRPNGQVILELPAMALPIPVTVLRNQDEHFGVRIGVGPYLVGFVRELGPAVTRPVFPEVNTEGPPVRIVNETQGRLLRVAEGTRITVFDRAIGVVRQAAWARELGTVGDSLDVFIAVDNTAAVRGLIPRDAATEAPAQTPAP